MMIYRRFPPYIQLLRPFTIIPPFIAGVLGTLAPVKYIGWSEAIVATLAGLSLAFLQACGQIVNQYADHELDKYAKPYRPIPSGKVSREMALGIGILLLFAGLSLSLMVSIGFTILCLIMGFMAVYYSLPPLSPRRVSAMLNNGWISVSRGLLPVIAVYSIFGKINDVLPVAIISFLWCLGFQFTKDVPDIKYDLMFGIKTIPNTYGIPRAKAIATLMLVAILVTIVVFNRLLYLTMVALGILCVLTFEKKAKLTENTWAWAGYYVGVGLIYVLLFIEHKLH